MATKKQNSADAAAAKAKKQKIVLIAGAVLLVGLGALQGPKLLKGGAPAADAPAAAAPSGESGSPSPGTPATPQIAVVKTGGSGPTAVLAGVSIGGSAGVGAGPAQLRTFTLFEAKDPFVQQASTETSGTTEPTSTPTLSDTEPGKTGAKGGSTKGGTTSGDKKGTGATPAAPPPAPPTYATVLMNGKAYYLALKQPFPTEDPVFVLASLKPKVARIGIAGGTFADGKTLPLVKGKAITLVNDATGARYVLKLVYTGTTPEQTESFAQAPK